MRSRGGQQHTKPQDPSTSTSTGSSASASTCSSPSFAAKNKAGVNLSGAKSGGAATTFHKQSKLFEELILALADPGRFELLPKKTTFIFTEEDILQNTLLHIREKCPEMVKNRAKFLAVVDKIVFGIHPY